MKSYQMSLMTVSMAAACLLLGIIPTQAQVINFDVPGATNRGQTFASGSRFNVGTNFVGQGALSDLGNYYWNAVLFNSTTSGGLLSDGITASPITLTMSGFNEYAGNNYGGNVTQGTPSALFTPFAYNGNTVTLNNLAGGTYNLFVYTQNGSDFGNATTITLGATTLTDASRSSVNNINTFIQGTNYVEFAGISPIAGALSLSFGGDKNFNGIQLQVEPTPEPSTYALAGLGLVSLFGFRSLNRRQTTS